MKKKVSSVLLDSREECVHLNKRRKLQCLEITVRLANKSGSVRDLCVMTFPGPVNSTGIIEGGIYNFIFGDMI